MPTKRPEARPNVWIHLAILVGAYALAFLLIAWAIISIPQVRRFISGNGSISKAEPKETEAKPPKLPQKFLPRREMDTAKIFNGVTFRSRVETEEGGQASLERNRDDAYLAELVIRIRVPKAVDTLEGLQRVNPNLGSLLPDLQRMLEGGRVSDFYHALYDLKVRALKSSADRLDALISRHNFYDCDTILELEHPITRRKVLLLQSEMDVVTDGTDPDRTLKTVGVTTTFQPFTSYRWPRKTKNPNPFAADRRARIAKIDRELTDAATSAARKRDLKAQRDQLRLEINDLERFSFLVAYGDPFIVLPGFIYRQRNHPFHPKLGDFAVVIHGDTLYPAIFGDTGPSYKTGEASLRICQEINPKSNALSRPVSALEVTYLIFPGSADPIPGPPDLGRWRTRCEQLLNEIGGHKGRLHAWNNLFKTAPTPTPSPSPTATPTPGGPATQIPSPAAPTPVDSVPTQSPTPPATSPNTPGSGSNMPNPNTFSSKYILLDRFPTSKMNSIRLLDRNTLDV